MARQWLVFLRHSPELNFTFFYVQVDVEIWTFSEPSVRCFRLECWKNCIFPRAVHAWLLDIISACSWFLQSLIGASFARAVPQYWFTWEMTTGTVSVFGANAWFHGGCMSLCHSSEGVWTNFEFPFSTLDHGVRAGGDGTRGVHVLAARAVRFLTMANLPLATTFSCCGTKLDHGVLAIGHNFYSQHGCTAGVMSDAFAFTVTRRLHRGVRTWKTGLSSSPCDGSFRLHFCVPVVSTSHWLASGSPEECEKCVFSGRWL